jgi:hypothetical protein
MIMNLSPNTRAISAFAYVLAWVIALSTGVPDLPINADGAAIQDVMSAHPTGAALQFIFAEGIAGALLLALVLNVAKLSGRKRFLYRPFIACGALCSTLSLLMCGMGLVVAWIAAPSGNAMLAGSIFYALNRLDGLKMWLFAGMVLAAIDLPIGTPRWMTMLGRVLAAALVVSGVAYAFLLQQLQWSAYVSGSLLLLWVGLFGIRLARQAQISPRAALGDG